MKTVCLGRKTKDKNVKSSQVMLMVRQREWYEEVLHEEDELGNFRFSCFSSKESVVFFYNMVISYHRAKSLR